MRKYVVHFQPCKRPAYLHKQFGFEPILNRASFTEPLMRCFAGHVVGQGLIGEEEGIIIENDLWLPPDFNEKIEKCVGLRKDPYIVSLYAFDHYGELPVTDHPCSVPRLYWATQAVYYSPGAAPFFRHALEMYLRRGTPQSSPHPLGGDNFMYDAAAWYDFPVYVYPIVQHIGYDSAVKCKFHQNPYLPSDPGRPTSPHPKGTGEIPPEHFTRPPGSFRPFESH